MRTVLGNLGALIISLTNSIIPLERALNELSFGTKIKFIGGYMAELWPTQKIDHFHPNATSPKTPS